MNNSVLKAVKYSLAPISFLSVFSIASPLRVATKHVRRRRSFPLWGNENNIVPNWTKPREDRY